MTRTTKEQRDAIRKQAEWDKHNSKRFVANLAETILALLDEIEGAEKGEAEPVAWEYRTKNSEGGWSMWSGCTPKHRDEILETGKSYGIYDAEVRWLYAAPVTAKVTEEMVEAAELVFQDGFQTWSMSGPEDMRSSAKVRRDLLPAALQAALSHKGGGNGG